jgi:hypothetical protein
MKNQKTHAFESIKAAAGSKRWPLRVIQAAKAAACPAFRGNRIYGDELDAWLLTHPEIKKLRTSGDLKGRKLLAECVKLETVNAVKKRELISRSWMAERVHVAAGKVDAFRLKSEAEHPLLFAAAAGDVPACREVVRKIWNEIMASMNSLEKEFRE